MTKQLCTTAAPRAACLPLRLVLLRVWCRELSVLDCEVDGERWVWHVSARPANDIAVCTCTSTRQERMENRSCKLHFPTRPREEGSVSP